MSKQKLITQLIELDFTHNSKHTTFQKTMNNVNYKLIISNEFFKLKRTIPPKNKLINLFNSDKFYFNKYQTDIRFITFIGLFDK